MSVIKTSQLITEMVYRNNSSYWTSHIIFLWGISQII